MKTVTSLYAIMAMPENVAVTPSPHYVHISARLTGDGCFKPPGCVCFSVKIDIESDLLKKENQFIFIYFLSDVVVLVFASSIGPGRSIISEKKCACCALASTNICPYRNIFSNFFFAENPSSTHTHTKKKPT